MKAQGKPRDRYTGELYYQAHRGTYTSQAKTKQGNRRSEFALREAEFWGSVAHALAVEKEEIMSRTADWALKIARGENAAALAGRAGGYFLSGDAQRQFVGVQMFVSSPSDVEQLERALTRAEVALPQRVVGQHHADEHQWPDGQGDEREIQSTANAVSHTFFPAKCC